MSYFCGSWAGQTCRQTNNQASAAWSTGFEATTGGKWYGDKVEFEAALLEQQELARLTPPASYYDIPPAPVPLPAGFGLLTWGVVVLAGLGARRNAVSKAALIRTFRDRCVKHCYFLMYAYALFQVVSVGKAFEY